MGKLTGRNSAATRRNLGGINLGLWRSCSSGRGKSSPTILSSRGVQSPSTSSPAPSPLKTLVHLLYPILYQNHKLVPVDANWFTWWKLICSDPLCILLLLWLWTWICFVSSYVCFCGHGWSLAISSHVNLVFVRFWWDVRCLSSSGVMWTSTTWHFTIVWA